MSPVRHGQCRGHVALVDKNKCDTKERSSESNSTGGSSGRPRRPANINAVVNVTQATDADPMYAKIWMSLTEQGHVTTVYAYSERDPGPSATMPYGAFHLDYLASPRRHAFNGSSMRLRRPHVLRRRATRASPAA